jgi:hypothetical protein
MQARHSRAECVFILEHHFMLKSFATVREAFSSLYPDSGLLNKATIQMSLLSLLILFILKVVF